MILPVIMAGGTGSRLWPLSRAMYPKQFLNITGEQTMLQDTVTRLEGLDCLKSITICNSEHRFLVAEQLENIGMEGDIILEPVGRNTAPAIALAAFSAIKDGNDPLLLVLAADHIIQDVAAFEKSVKTAQLHANKGKLVTFGVVANQPETGYGYIRRGEELSNNNDDDVGVYDVAEFVEKPVKQKAEEYLESGEYYWNSGMFLFKASCYLKELKRHCPEIYECCQVSFENAQKDLDFIRIQEEDFAQCESESIDYAVMEKTLDSVVVTLDASWSDIGSWSAIWDISDKDTEENLLIGDVISVDSSGCFVQSDNRLVSILGLKDIVVVDTKDALLVADKAKVQDIKQVVAHLKSAKREEWKIHREVYRPWGKYDSIDVGERYQVKRITVKPGAKLSIQKHHHRAEHWVVVSGTASVTNGDKTFLVTENESTYIPVGQIHALENPGKVPLELIEVQTGSYLGEDDIVRISDNYGRA